MKQKRKLPLTPPELLEKCRLLRLELICGGQAGYFQALRVQRHWPMKKVAKDARVGRSTIGDIERLDACPSNQTQAVIARVFGMRLDTFTDGAHAWMCANSWPV